MDTSFLFDAPVQFGIHCHKFESTLSIVMFFLNKVAALKHLHLLRLRSVPSAISELFVYNRI